jgi:DNA-binding MarR family transcriptional regulator
MPTKFTKIIGQLRTATMLRRNCLQSFAADMVIPWEYVPILDYIRQNSGCMQADIAKSMQVTPSAVTQSTKKLESMGLIEKKTDKDNLRVKKMYITDNGKETLQRGTQIFDEVDTLMFNGFSEDDITSLCELLDRINKNILSHNPDIGDGAKIQWEFKK